MSNSDECELPLLFEDAAEEDIQPSLSSFYKVVRTIVLFGLYLCFGVFSEMTGPIIPELVAQTHSEYHVMTLAISMRGAGNALGGIVGGLTIDKWLHFIDIFAAVFTLIYTCLGVGAAYVQDVHILFLVFYLQGSIEMWLQTAGSRIVLVIWKEKSAGALHILHMGYGVGSVVASLAIGSFLDPRLSDNTLETIYSRSCTENETSQEVSNKTEWITPEYPAHFVTAYWMLSSVGIMLTLIFTTYHFHSRLTNTRIDQISTQSKRETQTFRESLSSRSCSPTHPNYAAIIIITLFFFYFVAVPLNRAFVKLLFSYAREGSCMSVVDATGLVTAYYTAMTVGRMTAFLTSSVIHMKYILQVEMMGMFTCALTLYFFKENIKALWFLCIALAFFTGPTIPSAYGWANRYIEVTSTAQILPQIGAAIGDVTFMFGVGYSYERYGPYSVWSYQLSFVSTMWILTWIMQTVGSKLGDRYDHIGHKNL